MAQIYRIYVNDGSIILAPEGKNGYSAEAKSISGDHLITAISSLLDGDSAANFVLYSNDTESELEKLQNEVRFIEAGGGLVQQDGERYLFIFRKGKWDLPKGKLEAGESPEEGSRREVEEECGIRVKCILESLPASWHVYRLRGEIVLKKTYWFRMEAGSTEGMQPQTEEDITALGWFRPGNLDEVRANTYPLIRDIISHAIPSGSEGPAPERTG